MAEHLYNFAKLQLVGDIDADDTTIVVNYLPAWLTAANFRVQVDLELMKVTAISGTSLTVARGQESTTAVGHNGTDTPAFVDVVMTAAGLAQYVTENAGEGGGGGITPHYAQVYGSGAFSTISGSEYQCSFNTVQVDADGFYSAGQPTRLTVPTGLAGWYLAVGNVEWAANAVGQRSSALKVNGAAYHGGGVLPAAGGSIVTQIATVAMFHLAEGDYVELTAFQNSTSTIDVDAGYRLSLFRFAS